MIKRKLVITLNFEPEKLCYLMGIIDDLKDILSQLYKADIIEKYDIALQIEPLYTI